ncbi:MAG: alpha/beta hydrolase [Gordonia sp. (in: high G+C Gram-positive bacteria)]
MTPDPGTAARRVRVRRTTIAYGDEPAQFGHLYHAADGADVPERMRPVMLIHGGYWTTEFSLTIQSAIARHYAECGALVWNVEYRRVGEPGGGWPGTGRDVRAALAAFAGAVRKTLPDWISPRVDWNSVAVVGHSAGGQLAVWATATLGARPGTARVDLVVAQAAALDLVSAGRLARPSVRTLMGGSPDDVPQRYRDASPIEQPPFDAHVLVIHGAADTTIECAASRAYVETVAARGQSVELVVVPGEGHDVFVDPRSAGNRRTRRELGL